MEGGLGERSCGGGSKRQGLEEGCRVHGEERMRVWRGDGDEALRVGGSWWLQARRAVLGGAGARFSAWRRKRLEEKHEPAVVAVTISQTRKECHREGGPWVWSATCISMTPKL